jgi:hypothetical protein
MRGILVLGTVLLVGGCASGGVTSADCWPLYRVADQSVDTCNDATMSNRPITDRASDELARQNREIESISRRLTPTAPR